LSVTRVGLELTVLELDQAGTARAVRGLQAGLDRRDDVHVVRFAHPAGPGGHALRGLGRELGWLGPGGRFRRAARGVDVVHLPAALGPRRPLSVPTVVTVHDVLALDHPEWYGRANVLQQRLVLPRLVKNASLVIAPSAWTRDRVLTRFDADVRVIPWGVGPPFDQGDVAEEELARRGVSRPFVLTVGTVQPRKGLPALADVAENMQVVVAGARGWRDERLVADLGERVRFVGQVSDAELVNLIRAAEVLVFPSAHEGFGFPPLEAMACGTPVVAVAASAVPEVVGEAAELAEPDDADGIATAVRRVLESESRRAALRRAGLARAAEFSWDRCAAAYTEVYREAVGL
jgi:alpha-1,3-rhamnosyl/mannosyltransferase